MDWKIDSIYMSLYYITIFFMVLRILSFCLEKVNLNGLNSIKENTKIVQITDYTLIDLLLYTMYPTFIFIAPFVTFENFYQTFVSI